MPAPFLPAEGLQVRAGSINMQSGHVCSQACGVLGRRAQGADAVRTRDEAEHRFCCFLRRKSAWQQEADRLAAKLVRHESEWKLKAM